MKTNKRMIELSDSLNELESVYSSPTIDIISLHSTFTICNTSGSGESSSGETMTPENGIW